MNDDLYVKLWEEEVEILTYETGIPDRNPMFLEKRVYQGSSGKVYPLPFIDKIYDKKISKKYKMIFLENKYIRIEILPELGGRIQRAYDKTNNYDFVYHNEVIKPALVGLAGPWISGGIEFNWPQHHRPTTFLPVDYFTEENKDGSKAVFVGEIDRMYGTKGMASFTLYPDKAYLEIKGQLYNRTAFSQTFLWWANPAVAVNENTKSIFPPDVHAVFDHGKRDVSKFPIASGIYYKMDYSSGIDISRYKNIPVPTSYMAYHSDFNFVGGYDFGVNAGILHIADHHIAPGKKQWTWGCGEFGKAWDRNLTDKNGPYIELMTGVFTDNQPDFTWIEPYEEKTFTQYFMPYKDVGEVKNASIDAAINMEFDHNLVKLYAYSTSEFKKIKVVLNYKNRTIYDKITDISPEKTFYGQLSAPEEIYEPDYEMFLIAGDGKILISYKPKEKGNLIIPETAKPTKMPKEIKTNEELYLTGLHLEQYRHATYEPDSYYLEALKRDNTDIRVNNAYGKLILRRGLFSKSEKYFRKAIEKITWKNPNPYDGEAYYNLGLTLKFQNRLDEAFDAFFKCIWNDAYNGRGYFAIAQIATEKSDYVNAIEYVDKAIIKNYHNIRARNLKCAILRKLGMPHKAEALAKETIEIDKLDYGSRYELYRTYIHMNDIEKADKSLKVTKTILRDCVFSYLELSQDNAEAGLYSEAAEVLLMYIKNIDDKTSVFPMVYYNLGYYLEKLFNEETAIKYYLLGESSKNDYCFPNSLFSMIVLEAAIKNSEKYAMAKYYLGNLLYDKKQYNEAIRLWESSKELRPEYPTVHRNLALAYYNKLKEKEKARIELEKAFELNRNDTRILFELDQLYKKINIRHKERLEILNKYRELVEFRDDLFVEYITLHNNLGKYEEARKMINNKKFHPWEGGEGKIISQYVLCHVELGKLAINEKEYEKAIKLLETAKIYPENLGEGKLAGAGENNINYYLGLAYEGLLDKEKANEHFNMASLGLDIPSGVMFYNDQPADTIFYQGLSLLKLGRDLEGKSRFNKLYDYGEKHITDDVKIDYFAVSLPDFLVFDEDLNMKNKVHCKYLMGLGSIGLGNKKEALKNLKEANSIDSNHQGILIHLNLVK